MNVPLIMTPGPTQVRENVRLARAMKTTNPDLDVQFYDFYRDTCEKLGQLLKTKNQVRILCGEGILGLEAACASLTEPGDRVLVIENGIFGEGFADFVRIYGGQVVFFRGDRRRQIDVGELERFLDSYGGFKYATVVHCDTPSGVLNDVSRICPMLKSRGIMTVVDSVSAIGGEELKVDEWSVDIALGGSQKCLSAPPGLTFLSISQDAYSAMQRRRTPIASFYCNLLLWKDYYEQKWFPYTPPVSDIVAFRQAVDNVLEDRDILKRHKVIAEAVRQAVREAGLDLYIKEGFSNTVTAIEVPEGVDEKALRQYMLDRFNVMIAGSFGYLAGKVLRIGHMGENARVDCVSYTLFALQKSLERFGFKCRCDMAEVFMDLVHKPAV
ncbi:pyridoxal-phosphate-dependent aminotransferase family protein [Caldanaerobius polysaccharolyticus]|uniref:pyridoxal-phosphate-dependent aminotransferase family protein n=1 Tax=Caldanaerobius polysaccharolyticus TaxID=44256 RepID=UPI00047C905A|nr:alanine--glyoxylate aminotransferase family protein [Caldanaerobius polysaccharolyticus]